MLPKKQTALPTTLALAALLSLIPQNSSTSSDTKAAELQAEADKRLIEAYHQQDLCIEYGERWGGTTFNAARCGEHIPYPAEAYARQTESAKLAKKPSS